MGLPPAEFTCPTKMDPPSGSSATPPDSPPSTWGRESPRRSKAACGRLGLSFWVAARMILRSTVSISTPGACSRYGVTAFLQSCSRVDAGNHD